MMRFYCMLLALAAVVVSSLAADPLLDGSTFTSDKFTPVTELTDEFDTFDHDRWYDVSPRWSGRQPGLFAKKNVKVKRGKLMLTGVKEKKSSNAFDGAPDGYEKYTTAYVETKKLVRYGYFETKAKPSNSRLSSSFWASLDTPKKWTEIDIYELGGAANFNGTDFRKRVNTNAHVFRFPKKGIEPSVNAIHTPSFYIHSAYLRSSFNTFGLDWSKKYLIWTFNGKPIRQIRNKYWKQKLALKFDVETMPNWFGLPSKKTLPAVYKIKHMRVWTRKARSSSSRMLKAPSRQFESLWGSAVPEDGTEVFDENDEVVDESSLDDDAVSEVSDLTEAQTIVRPDGLQRAPIPGSNEREYLPIPEPFGGWSALVDSIDNILPDVADIRFDQNESVDINDFDEEIVLPASGPAVTPEAAGPANEPVAAPSAAPASATTPAAAPETLPVPAAAPATGLTPATAFGSFIPSATVPEGDSSDATPKGFPIFGSLF